MADQGRDNRGLRFPRMQNSREQFNQTHEPGFGANTLRNTSYPMNSDGESSNSMTRGMTNARNPRFINEFRDYPNPRPNPVGLINSPDFANNDQHCFDETTPSFQSPPVDFRMSISNVRQPVGSFSEHSNYEPVHPQFRCRSSNSNSSIRPPAGRHMPDYHNRFPHPPQSHTGSPLDVPRMHHPPPRHGPPPVRMTHPPAGPPPVAPPYPQQLFSQPPPPVGLNPMHPFPAQNVGFRDLKQLQQNDVSPLSNHSSPSHQQYNQERSAKPSIETQKDVDEKWIANWLIGRLGKQKTEAKQLKINEVHDIIHKSMVLLATLKKQKSHLQSILNSADSVTWQQEADTAEETKIQLCNEQNKLTDEVVDNLELKLLARQKKRERIKRKRKADYEEKLREEKNRELKHQAIDKWRRQIVQRDIEEKQNKEIKASADVFLSEVRKKLSDVKKSTELLTALQKLRKIRKDFAEKQGRYSSVVYDEHFQKTVDNLTTLLKKQQDLYLEEEKTLKVMLENDWVEALEKEKEEKEHIDLVKRKREQRKHQEMLFGKQETPSPSSDLYPFYEYYTQAKHDFDALLQIRHGWDMYLVPESFPGSSRIPDGWVLPSEPSSERWASSLKH